MSCVIIVSTIFAISLVNSDGFDYPPELPPPVFALASAGTGSPFTASYETPIAIYQTTTPNIAYWNCLASYHKHVLDTITLEAPIVRAPDHIIDVHGNSETRVLCGLYGFFTIRNYIQPQSIEYNHDFMVNNGLDPALTEISSDVLACDVDDAICLDSVAALYGYVPSIMANIVSYQVIEYIKNDGWNADGSHTSHGRCTANCRPYRDTTNYMPVNNPYIKDKIKGNEHRWAPLLEDNGLGFMHHYDHVVPHIGLTATTRVYTREELEANYAPDPNYNYQEEKQYVIQELADTAVNDTRKMLAEFFDDKTNVLGTIGTQTLFKFLLPNLQYEELLIYLNGVTDTEYETVVQSWLEKRRWDRVRPTTMIKNDGRKRITTYGGPYQGVQSIKSVDFEAYIRVMPHSEYPSASSCICQGLTEFAAVYMEKRHQITDIPITLQFEQGSSFIEPGSTPSEPLIVSFKSLEDFNIACGQSRVWGGMHFSASIPGGKELCTGIGSTGYDKVIYLLDGHPL